MNKMKNKFFKHSCLRTNMNKRGLMKDFIRIILWVIFLTIMLISVYYLIKNVGV